MWSHWDHLYAKTLKDLKPDHCASVRPIDAQPDNQGFGWQKRIFFHCSKAPQDNAEDDVILLGSTTMHQSHQYLSERLSVSVINPGHSPTSSPKPVRDWA